MSDEITPIDLREVAEECTHDPVIRNHLRGAADIIEALRAELAELRAQVAVPDDVAKDALEDLADTVSLALSKAWSLGQTYWSQADSESYKQNKKAAETQQTFNALTDATRAAILAAKENKP